MGKEEEQWLKDARAEAAANLDNYDYNGPDYKAYPAGYTDGYVDHARIAAQPPTQEAKISVGNKGLTPEEIPKDIADRYICDLGNTYEQDREELEREIQAYGDKRAMEISGLTWKSGELISEPLKRLYKALSIGMKEEIYTEAEVREREEAVFGAARLKMDGIYNVPFDAWKYPIFEDYLNREK